MCTDIAMMFFFIEYCETHLYVTLVLNEDNQ